LHASFNELNHYIAAYKITHTGPKRRVTLVSLFWVYALDKPSVVIDVNQEPRRVFQFSINCLARLKKSDDSCAIFETDAMRLTTTCYRMRGTTAMSGVDLMELQFNVSAATGVRYTLCSKYYLRAFKEL
jgi:hypothetical protein